ncbi:MAG: O-succinylhomoserine sulfhydrylase [Thioalkalivibrionaceae bacterium]
MNESGHTMDSSELDADSIARRDGSAQGATGDNENNGREHDDATTWGLATQAIRTGYRRTQENEHSEAIFPTSSFVFASAAEAAARFSGESPGNIYARFTNPTTRAFEARLAALEGGEACVATASGMAAILAMVMGLLQAGDHVVCSRSVFGTTTVLFNQYLTRFGVEVSYVPLADLEAWERAVRPETRLFFCETPSNPTTEIVDIAALADVAHAKDILLAVDNCFCTPALQRPLALGADLVIHSATKYLDGQGRALGGAVVGDAECVGKQIYGFLRTAGPTMSPFNAWIFLKGLETLSLRMRAHSEYATRIAAFLAAHPAVESVYHPSRPEHPQHALASRQQSGFGGVLSFRVRGGRTAAWSVIDATKMLSITANLGDAKTTITHPATTTHGRLTPEARAAQGIDDSMIRVAVGLEDVADIEADLARGLDRLSK